MAKRDLLHIIVPAAATAESYSPHPPKIDRVNLPVPHDPLAHGKALMSFITNAKTEADARHEQAKSLIPEGVKPGLYIQFDSIVDVPLKLESLENKKKHIELCAVQDVETDVQGVKETIQRATVL